MNVSTTKTLVPFYRSEYARSLWLRDAALTFAFLTLVGLLTFPPSNSPQQGGE